MIEPTQAYPADHLWFAIEGERGRPDCEKPIFVTIYHVGQVTIADHDQLLCFAPGTGACLLKMMDEMQIASSVNSSRAHINGIPFYGRKGGSPEVCFQLLRSALWLLVLVPQDSDPQQLLQLISFLSCSTESCRQGQKVLTQQDKPVCQDRPDEAATTLDSL